MTKLTRSLDILISLLSLSFTFGGTLTMASALETWCVANPSTNTSALLANLDYACGHVDCHLIQQGGSCFYPNNYIHHASFAMNMYYQTMGASSSFCDFRGSGLVTLTDPSYENCSYDSVEGDSQPEQLTRTWCVAKPGTSDYMLQQNINYACNHVDCSPAHDSGSCLNPTTLINHASFAMNLYYHNLGRNKTSCDFRGTGLIVLTDPSCGNCIYQSSNY